VLIESTVPTLRLTLRRCDAGHFGISFRYTADEDVVKVASLSATVIQDDRDRISIGDIVTHINTVSLYGLEQGAVRRLVEESQDTMELIIQRQSMLGSRLSVPSARGEEVVRDVVSSGHSTDASALPPRPASSPADGVGVASGEVGEAAGGAAGEAAESRTPPSRRNVGHTLREAGTHTAPSSSALDHFSYTALLPVYMEHG